MYTVKLAALILVIMIVGVFGEDENLTEESITSAKSPEQTSTSFSAIGIEEDLVEKALISKKRKKENYDRVNMKYLSTAADDRRPGRYHHHHGGGYAHRKKKHRTLLSPPKERKPNIILILTDDQDVELGSLNFMPRTLRLLRDGGAEFRHAYVTTPMCCPSRSSLLTGMYVHNHNVFTNNENCSSQAWQRTHETRTFATYLSNAGYRTGYFGKYLNKYNGSYVPGGWREWGGLIMNSRYYNYSINLNGRRVRHGDQYERDYYTDLIANDSVSFLRQSKQYFSRKPVMLVLSFPAPHGPEDSAPQFSDMFFNVTTHHTPAYDYAPNPDKQWILQVTNRMQGIHKQFTDLLMTKRLQTLQSVDVAVERIYQELKHIGELENTYIVYTSDHGYHLGQFGLVKGKSFPFEFDVRVPFLVRGPGIQPGTKIDDIVLNIDLAPTFLDMAGVDTPSQMDGRSFLKLLHPPRGTRRVRWPDTFLIESSGRRETTPEPVRPKIRVKPVELHDFENGSSPLELSEESGEIEATDDDDAYHHLEAGATPISLHDDLAYDNKIPGLPKPAVSLDCERMKDQVPCGMGQKWFCFHDGMRWRKHKCRVQSCACFTPQGYMYTRPPLPGDEIRLDESLLHVLHGRRKRSLDDSNISEIVDDLDAELEDAEYTQIALRNSSLWQCSVTSSGLVNCSDIVYSDYSSWKQARDHTDAKIRLLKSHLIALKEIKRHLKENRPLSHSNDSTTTTEAFIDLQEVTNTVVVDETTTEEIGTETSTFQEIAETSTASKGDDSWSNSINRVTVRSEQDTCFCALTGESVPRRNDEKRRLKEEKHRKKERKARKKLRLEKACLSEKMNCFNHDNEHWRTPPYWTEGPFCFCMNANNNTYSCLRTINATHNFLYCEFVTGLSTFYNIRIDPFEQLNRVSSLTVIEKRVLSEQLEELRSCRGTKECTVGSYPRRN